MRESKVSWAKLAGICLSGVMLVAVYPPVGLGWLAYVALIPYLLVLHSCQRQRQVITYTLLLAIIWGTGLFYFTLFMPATTVLERLTAYVAVLSIFSLEVVGFALGVRFLLSNGRSSLVNTLSIGLWWATVEWLGARFFFGFSPFLGLTQWQYPSLVILARYIGLHGISALVAVVNTGLYLMMMVAKNRHYRRRWVYVATSICFLLVAILVWPKNITQPADSSVGGNVEGELLLVVAIQSAFTMQEYEATNSHPSALYDLFERLLTQSSAGVNAAGEYWQQQYGTERPLPPVVVLWPETVLHEPLLSYPDYYARLRQELHKTGFWLVAGLPWLENDDFYNAAILLNPAGEIVDHYAKVRTIPIAEGWVKPGAAWQPLTLDTTALGVALCSEIIDPLPIKKLVANGAQLVAVLSSMDYLGPTSAPVLQAAFAPFRAAEYGRYLVMTSSVGITLVATPTGRITQQLAWGSPDELITQVPLARNKTPYAQLGDIMPFIGLLVMVATWLCFWGRKRIQRRK